MSGLRDTVNRTNPNAGAGTTYFSILKYPALVDADLNAGAGGPINTERVSLQWGPLSFSKIAHQVTTAGDYPSEESRTISSSSGATVTLSGNLSYDPTGLLFMVQDATTAANDYTWYRIVSFNGTNQVTLNRNPSSHPTTFANGDTFKLFVDCEGLNALFIKTEFSNSTGTVDLVPALYDTGRTPAGTPVARAAMRFNSGLVTITNLGFNTDNTNGSSYYHGVAYSVNCAGAIGAKIRIDSTPSNGASVSLWAAAS